MGAKDDTGEKRGAVCSAETAGGQTQARSTTENWKMHFPKQTELHVPLLKLRTRKEVKKIHRDNLIVTDTHLTVQNEHLTGCIEIFLMKH